MCTVAWKNTGCNQSEYFHPPFHFCWVYNPPHGFISGFFASYLEFLSSDGLHVALLADGEGVGDLGVCGVDLGPGEGITILGDLCDQLVVTAFLNDVIRDTYGGDRRGVCGYSSLNVSRQRSKVYVLLWLRSVLNWVCLTKQLAELIVALLGLGFPSSSEGHIGDVWWVEAWEQRCWGRLREKQGTETETVSCLYTAHLSPPPSSTCDDTRGQLQLKMVSTIGYEGEGNNLHERAFMEVPSSE